MNRLGRRLLAGAAVLALCGCGTTVPQSSHGPSAGTAQAGLTEGSAPQTSSTVPTPGATNTTSGPSGVGAANGGAARPGVPGSAAVTASTIRLGVLVNPPYVPPGTTTPAEDWEAIAKALINDLNAHGGLAGRQVIADYWAYDAPTASDETNPNWQPTQEQAACSHFTEDAHVFAVIAFTNVEFSAKCYAGHHVPVFDSTYLAGADDQELEQLAPWIIPDDSPDLDTQARVLAAALQREHFLDHHIGIAVIDYPSYHRAIDKVLVPAIRRLGGAVATADTFYSPPDAQDGAKTSEAAVLRWKHDGVDRVVLFALPNQAWPILADAALAQGFTPMWGLDSQEWAQQNIDATNGVPPPERNAVAAGWFPLFDVLQAQYPLFPAERQCLDVVNQALGTTYDERAKGNGGAALIECRKLALVKQAMSIFAGKTLPATALWSAVHDLGASYHALDIPAADFAPGKPDGLAVYRALSFHADCTCMKYDTDWMPVPR